VAEIHRGATLTPGKAELVEAWMGRQRWYAGKAATPAVRRLSTWRLGDPAGAVGVEVLVVADVSTPAPVVYQVPLTYRGRPEPSLEHALVGTTEHSVLGTRWVYDGPHDPVYAAQLLELVQGRVRAESGSQTDALDETVTAQPGRAWRREVTARSSRVLSGEQSNTSVIIDAVDASGEPVPVIVKVFRMLADGENPDVVLQSALVEAGSTRVPAVVGSVAGQWPQPGEGGDPATDGGRPAYGHFVFAQEFLPGVEDAWRVALESVRADEDFTGPARDLGAATAEVHATLARALGTTPTSPDAAHAIVTGMRDRYVSAAAEVGGLHDLEDEVMAIFDAAEDVSWPALQHVHGDCHLGQVLWADGDFGGADAASADRILDFTDAADDRVNLSLVDANTALDGNQAFAFIGAGAFTGSAGELRYEQLNGNTFVQGDTNGDGTADFWIRLDGLHTLGSDDLVF